MADRLSKESEQKLTKALDKVSELIDAGQHPNDALCKVAEAEKILPGHVRLMVNAINTGRTNAHRLTADEFLTKSAAIPLANGDIVMERLFPTDIKTKSAAYNDSAVASCYSDGIGFIRDMEERRKRALSLQYKLARVDVPALPTDTYHAFKTAYGKVERNQHAVESARMKVAEVRQRIMSLTDQLSEYFQKVDAAPFDDVYVNSSIAFGKAAEAVLERFRPQKKNPNLGWRHKKAHYFDACAAPYTFITKIVKTASELTAAKANYEQLAESASKEAQALLSPFVPDVQVGGSILGDQSSLTLNKSAASALGSLIGSGIGLLSSGHALGEGLARGMPPQPDRSSDLQALFDPVHENQLRSLRSEALLNDLLANDDVIKGFHPSEAVDAFNEISQLAPYAADKKAIMRDLMRKRLSGGAQALDQFTVSDALKTQEALQNIQTPNRTSLSLLSSIGALPREKFND